MAFGPKPTYYYTKRRRGAVGSAS